MKKLFAVAAIVVLGTTTLFVSKVHAADAGVFGEADANAKIDAHLKVMLSRMVITARAARVTSNP